MLPVDIKVDEDMEKLPVDFNVKEISGIIKDKKIISGGSDLNKVFKGDFNKNDDGENNPSCFDIYKVS